MLTHAGAAWPVRAFEVVIIMCVVSTPFRMKKSSRWQQIDSRSVA
jgi:hypothetical protein